MICELRLTAKKEKEELLKIRNEGTSTTQIGQPSKIEV